MKKGRLCVNSSASFFSPLLIFAPYKLLKHPPLFQTQTHTHTHIYQQTVVVKSKYDGTRHIISRRRQGQGRMKSFRRRCGEGITTPVGMREAGTEGEGKDKRDEGEVKNGKERV